MDLLRISDGTTAVDLAAAPAALLEYVPQAAAPDAAPGTAVAETLKVALGGADLAAALETRSRLACLIEQAGRAAAGSGEPGVYVECRRAAGCALYRSELLGGRLAELDFDGYWPARGVVRVAVHVLRQPSWEGPETELALLDAIGNPVSGGLPCPCGGELGLAEVTGELPAALRLALTNPPGADAIGQVWAALRSAATEDHFAPLLEGEAALEGGVTQPPAGDLRSSGGYYRSFTWEDAGEVRLAEWVVPAEWLAQAGWYRVLARLAAALATEGMWARLQLLRVDGAVLWSGARRPLSAITELADLGTVRLPPNDLPAAGPANGPGAAPAALRCELYAGHPASGAHNLRLDYLAWLSLDGCRSYAVDGTILAGGATLIDDGLVGGRAEPEPAVGVAAAGEVAGGVLAVGRRLWLRPGARHRLALVWQSLAGQAPANRELTARLWYRPRVTVP